MRENAQERKVRLTVRNTQNSEYEEISMFICKVRDAMYIPGNKNISILHLSCRTSDLQFSLVLQTHELVL